MVARLRQMLQQDLSSPGSVRVALQRDHRSRRPSSLARGFWAATTRRMDVVEELRFPSFGGGRASRHYGHATRPDDRSVLVRMRRRSVRRSDFMINVRCGRRRSAMNTRRRAISAVTVAVMAAAGVAVTASPAAAYPN